MTELSTETDKLAHTVAELRLTVAELKITLAGMVTRDIEDRADASRVETRLSLIEVWRGRIQGQLAMLAFGVGILGTVVVARIMG